MTAQQEPEYRITKSELKEYARLKAHENSADFAPLSKVHELSEKYENEIRSRGSIQQTEAPTPFITWKMKKCPVPSIHTRKLAINEIGNDDDGFSRLFDLPPIKEGDIICVYRYFFCKSERKVVKTGDVCNNAALPEPFSAASCRSDFLRCSGNKNVS